MADAIESGGPGNKNVQKAPSETESNGPSAPSAIGSASESAPAVGDELFSGAGGDPFDGFQQELGAFNVETMREALQAMTGGVGSSAAQYLQDLPITDGRMTKSPDGLVSTYKKQNKPQLTDDDLRTAVQNLGASTYADRQAAAATLRENIVRALPFLTEQLYSRDKEKSDRAATIINESLRRNTHGLPFKNPIPGQGDLDGLSELRNLANNPEARAQRLAEIDRLKKIVGNPDSHKKIAESIRNRNERQGVEDPPYLAEQETLLKKLDETRNDVAQLTPEKLANLERAPENLHINRFDTDRSLALIDGLRARENVRRLDIEDSPITDNGLSHVRNLENLEALIMRGATNGNPKITDEGFANLVGGLSRLNYIEARDMKLTDAALNGLRGNRTITTLDVQGNAGITDGSAGNIAGMSQLTKLNLRETSVGDATVQRLANNKIAQSLEYLDLRGTNITDASIPSLVESFPNLKILDVDNTRITPAGRQRLEEAMARSKPKTLIGAPPEPERAPRAQ